jgi:ferric-dicitrate binding protein FerR (iron transport regulator)
MKEAILIRFLQRRCTPSEIREVEQWVAADKANAEWLFEAERIWGLKDEWRFADQQEAEKAYRRFLAAVRKEKPAGKNPFPMFLKYAAAIAAIILLSVNLYLLLGKNRTETAMHTIEVPRGQRVVLTLPDGTRVWLNSQTTLTYPASFSAKNRDVTLAGEGFFEVVRNESSPFTVHSPLMHVKVLGTKFDVRAYPGETALVTLSEGSVEVSTTDRKNRITLRPRQQLACSEQTGLLLTDHTDTERTNSWITGELAFVHQPLAEIAAELERRFDVQIHICDTALAEDMFTCRFKGNVTIEQILNFLKETQRMDYQIKDRQINIIKYKTPMKKN